MMANKKLDRFVPNFTITAGVATGLMRIEAVKQGIVSLPITPRVLANLRETARLFSTHYSTLIEGNRPTPPIPCRALQSCSQLHESSGFAGWRLV
jgi:hypothetical protein